MRPAWSACESIHLLQANAVYNKTDTLWGAQSASSTPRQVRRDAARVVNIAGSTGGVQIGMVNIVRYGEQRVSCPSSTFALNKAAPGPDRLSVGSTRNPAGADIQYRNGGLGHPVPVLSCLDTRTPGL
jgi:hypothetical protein